jgi:hypothetical protein
MSRNVAAIFGKATRPKFSEAPLIAWPLPDCLTGLEIEVESTPNAVMPTSFAPFWNKTKDGSLRNGSEYVLAMPMKGVALSQAIHQLFAGGTRFERSTTGSTHIHLDMMEDGVSQDIIKVMVLLMYVFESAIFQIADRGREWCGYTNKLTSAPEVLVGAVLNASEDNYDEFRLMCEDIHGLGRYYGINVMALHKYGSLEFRYFPTATSVEEVVDWVCLCQNFKRAAMELGSVDKLVEVLESEEMFDRFLTTYFDKWKDTFVQSIPQTEAVANYQKAMAVASTQALKKLKTYNEEFDERAITNNKVLATRFMRNKVMNGGINVLVTQYVQMAPGAHTVKVGTPMLHGGRVYISTGNDWAQPPFDDYGSAALLTPAVKRKAIQALMKVLPDIRLKCRDAGHAATTGNSAVVRIQGAIINLCDSLDIPVPAWPEIRTLTPEATVVADDIRPRVEITGWDAGPQRNLNLSEGENP